MRSAAPLIYSGKNAGLLSLRVNWASQRARGKLAMDSTVKKRSIVIGRHRDVAA
jgi:hypothetical protein